MSQPASQTERKALDSKATPGRSFARTVHEQSMTHGFTHAMAILAVIAIGILTETLAAYRLAEVAHEKKATSLAFASELRARSDRELNSVLYLASGVVGYLVVRHEQIDPDEVNQILGAVYAYGRHIRNFTVAVGHRISYVYPLVGNEAVLGRDYRDLTAQWPSVDLAIQSRKVVLTGPVNLVQGGTGLIYRAPIFVQDQFWGILSTVIDIPSLQQATFKGLDKDRFDITIRAEETAGSGGGILWGNAKLFSDPTAVQLEAEMPSGKWIYAVRAKEQSSSLLVWSIRGAGWVLAALTGICVFIVLRQRNELARIAGFDSLTELPNRRLFDDRLEQAIRRQVRHDDYQVAAVFIDMNGFKPINDQFGHKIGDQVLRTVALRLRDEVRVGDTVSRWAGDEFALILEEASPEMVEQLIRRLQQRITEPFEVDGIQLAVSAAIGAAFYPKEAATSVALLELADQRMYEDKEEQKRRA